MKTVPPHDLPAIMNEISSAPPRSAIIVGVGFVEQALEKLLITRLREPTTSRERDEMYSEAGILGSFDRKVSLAYYMRLIGPEVRRDINLLKRIRNEVAHNINPVTFDSSEIASRCRELTISVPDKSMLEFLGMNTDIGGIRARFISAVHRLASALLAKAMVIKIEDVDEKFLDDKAAMRIFIDFLDC